MSRCENSDKHPASDFRVVMATVDFGSQALMCLEGNYAAGFDNSVKHWLSTFFWTKAFGKVRNDAIARQFESIDLGMKKPWIFKEKP
jgi:hypothetical protein